MKTRPEALSNQYVVFQPFGPRRAHILFIIHLIIARDFPPQVICFQCSASAGGEDCPKPFITASWRQWNYVLRDCFVCVSAIAIIQQARGELQSREVRADHRFQPFGITHQREKGAKIWPQKVFAVVLHESDSLAVPFWRRSSSASARSHALVDLQMARLKWMMVSHRSFGVK